MLWPGRKGPAAAPAGRDRVLFGRVEWHRGQRGWELQGTLRHHRTGLRASDEARRGEGAWLQRSPGRGRGEEAEVEVERQRQRQMSHGKASGEVR